MINRAPGRWRRYAALGDSFTEGLEDDPGPDGRHRGWADRLAEALAGVAQQQGDPGIEYANLAVRGRLIHEVVREQVPAAIVLRPDLTSLAVGVNDTLRRHFDLDAAATDLEAGVRDLRAAGGDVLVVAFGDPSRRSTVMGAVRARMQAYNSAVEAIAGHYGCYLIRYWDVAAMDDDRYWHEDRLHLSPAGHGLAMLSALEALGLGSDSWRTPVVPGPSGPVHRRLVGHARWVGGHAVPWALRRARGSSSGDGVGPKHPRWVQVGAGAPAGA